MNRLEERCALHSKDCADSCRRVEYWSDDISNKVNEAIRFPKITVMWSKTIETARKLDRLTTALARIERRLEDVDK